MKKIFIYCSTLLILFAACKKNEDPTSNRLNIRYEFTSTLTGNFGFQTVSGTQVFSGVVNTSSWSKLVTLQANDPASDSAKFSVFQPFDWTGTNKQADLNLKIFVNDVEKGNKSVTMVAVDRPTPVELFIKL